MKTVTQRIEEEIDKHYERTLKQPNAVVISTTLMYQLFDEVNNYNLHGLDQYVFKTIFGCEIYCVNTEGVIRAGYKHPLGTSLDYLIEIFYTGESFYVYKPRHCYVKYIRRDNL